MARLMATLAHQHAKLHRLRLLLLLRGIPGRGGSVLIRRGI
jgi:hypothetical protein